MHEICIPRAWEQQEKQLVETDKNNIWSSMKYERKDRGQYKWDSSHARLEDLTIEFPYQRLH